MQFGKIDFISSSSKFPPINKQRSTWIKEAENKIFYPVEMSSDGIKRLIGDESWL